MVVSEPNKGQYQVVSVIILKENIRKVQWGITKCQHTFEILVETFLHAQDGNI